ncbi:DUF1275 domain-containing protein [Aquabacter sp. L1I39]|uniref:YoaK family protein n=1 Tax=Aquabacter sp. L1I39 TaxID=2820278 RepID=UPI001AD9C983|nr:YoaK family protein [Aquabacter sp. L1I39]QTL04285.1 DUF1275 domain-containing protein [Aquabacter sp. L1I39]
MLRYDLHLRFIAVCLSALAGFVDALGFIELGGFFVSFMSGNSTRVGVGLENAGESLHWAIAAGLISSFVSGVVTGTIAGRLLHRRRHTVLLLLVATMLALAGTLHALEFGFATVAAMAFAMGVENTVFERNGEVSIGLTYMTGTLVKLGQHIAAAFMGGSRTAWLSYFGLWSGLVGGAFAGALLYPHMGLNALWLAVAGALLLAAGTRRFWFG